MRINLTDAAFISSRTVDTGAPVRRLAAMMNLRTPGSGGQQSTPKIEEPYTPSMKDMRRGMRGASRSDDSSSGRQLVFSSDPEKWDVKPKSETITFEFSASLNDLIQNTKTKAKISEACLRKMKEKNEHNVRVGDMSKCVLIRAVIDSVESDAPIPIGLRFSQIKGRQRHAATGRRLAAVIPAFSKGVKPARSDMFTTEEVKTTATQIQLSMLTKNNIRSGMIASEFDHHITDPDTGATEVVPMYHVRTTSLLAGYAIKSRKEQYDKALNERYGKNAPQIGSGETVALVRELADNYIGEILDWKNKTGLTHIDFNDFEAELVPTMVGQWAKVGEDKRIGNPEFPELRPADMAKERTISVCCTVDFYLPETIEKMRRGSAN